MGTIKLTSTEKTLCRRVAHGDRVLLEPHEEIRAVVIRHIVLELPLIGKGVVKPAARALLRRPSTGKACRKTAVGIRIRGGIIRGRLKLDSAAGQDGAPMCPLEFHETWFDGGFSGANSRFGRLKFRDCHFNDRSPLAPRAPSPPERSGPSGETDFDPDDSGPLPTIELSGATIESDLDMRGIKPLGDGDGRIPAADQLPFLWIRAIGTRIDGNLDLSCAHLDAPDDDSSARSIVDPPVQPLNLSLARIEGDFFFLGRSRSHGRISARSAQIAGDVWMSGARITCRKSDPCALFFQLATIGGGLMLDGRREKADHKSGRFLPFVADGEVNLFAIRVGGSIVLNNAVLSAGPNSEENLCLCLTGARVGGRLEIKRRHENQRASLEGRIRFDRMEVGSVVRLEDVEIGCDGPLEQDKHCIDARVLRAKHLLIHGVGPPAGGIGPDGTQGAPAILSINLRNSRLEQLTISDTRLTGPLEAAPLHCEGNIDLAGTIAEKVNFEGSTVGGSLDISRLEVAGPDACLSLKDATIGGSLDISGLKVAGPKACLSLRDATIGRALRLMPREPQSRFELDGKADLTGLTCDTLDDDIGQRWGKKVVMVMNHFTYRRTGERCDEFPGKSASLHRKSIYRIVGDWIESRREAGGWLWRRLRRGPVGARPAAAGQKPRKPTYRIVSDWIQSRRADGVLPWRFFPRRFLSDDTEFWEAWQHRRNWIYQQHTSPQTGAALANPFVSITRHEIREEDYHPQPFEQAIRVARAEGRDDFATNFEIHKQYLEWRLFNQRVRWGLAGIAISLAALWLIIQKPSLLSDIVALLACLITIGLMIFGSWIRGKVRTHVVDPVLRMGDPPIYLDAAIVLALLLGLWVGFRGPLAWIIAASAAFLVAIELAIAGSWIAARFVKPAGSGTRADWAAAKSSKLLTWLVYWIPAIVLLVAAGWVDAPFHFIVAFLIFVVVRLTGVFAHQAMRFGFGYLRRPILAVVTLIGAFLVGWAGVGLANSRHMFVLAAEPVAGLVAPDRPKRTIAQEKEPMLLMGSEHVGAADPFVRDVSCAHEISEALYALDVLIPIVDLGEERRCEIRRIARIRGDARSRGEGHAPRPDAGPQPRQAGQMGFLELTRELPGLALDDHRFWWWMKALYAIAGWFIVSLSILTFAQANRTHAEPPHEHK